MEGIKQPNRSNTLSTPTIFFHFSVVGNIFVTPCFCSVVGAVVISVGFYVVMWGKANEEMGEEFGVVNSLESPSTLKAPLLGEER